MIKILWTLVGINTTGLLFFIGAYFVLNEGKKVDGIESGWMTILSALGCIVILLAALPLHYGNSIFSRIAAAFFAVLPLLIALGIFLNSKLPSFKKQSTYARTYYNDKTQIAIASAIEKSDTSLLKELIRGQNLNIQGIKVWDWPGLNYLQFAVRLRSNRFGFPFNEEANIAAIRILLANGSAATPALAEATKQLSTEMISELIAAGADPNTAGFVNHNPLLFETIGSSKKENDMAILLVQKGANVNAKHDNGFTPVMFAAYNAGTTPLWNDTWRLVRYMLEEADADYSYTAVDGYNLAGIIKNIIAEAKVKKITMPADFNKVVIWLQQHKVAITI